MCNVWKYRYEMCGLTDVQMNFYRGKHIESCLNVSI